MKKALEIKEPDVIKDADLISLMKKLNDICKNNDTNKVRSALITLYASHTWEIFGSDVQAMYKFIDELADKLKKGGLEHMRNKG